MTESGNKMLDDALRIAQVFLILAAAAFCIFATAGLVEIKASVLSELTDLHRVTVIVGVTAGEVQKSAVVARAASVEQKAYFKGISQRATVVLENSAQAAAALTVMIQRTDRSVNDVMLPQMANAVANADHSSAMLIADTDKTVQALAETSKQTTVAMASAAKVIGDPAIPETLERLDGSSQQMNQGLTHLNNSTAMLENKVRQMTKPASWAKTVGLAILSVGSDVANMLRGF